MTLSTYQRASEEGATVRAETRQLPPSERSKERTKRSLEFAYSMIEEFKKSGPEEVGRFKEETREIFGDNPNEAIRSSMSQSIERSMRPW